MAQQQSKLQVRKVVAVKMIQFADTATHGKENLGLKP
jgi:hypothetical protein